MPIQDVPSFDRVQRTLAVDIAYTMSRMRVLERLPGNPIAINYRWIDETAVALTARLPSFSRVVGLRGGHERHIEPLVSWYREHGAGAGPPDRPPSIERVNSAEAMDDYLDAYVAGWEIPERDQNQFKFNVRPWLDQPGWSLYVGRLNGEPAAAGTLYLKDGTGYLADAATKPSCRHHGLQTALLRRRIHDAGAAGADLVFSGATPFSTSHRNMERVGMRVQFMRSLWTPC